MRGIIALTVMVMTASPAPATTYLVRPDGTGDFPTIQAAIDAATTGDFVELTDGTFTSDGNRDLDFLGKAITVRSESGACVVDCEGLPGRRGAYFHSGEAGTTVLGDITIRGGSTQYGGAILCASSSPRADRSRSGS